MNTRILFCSRCGGDTQLLLPPDGDVRKRDICTSCGHIHYVNPINVVGTIPVWQGRVLLCQRNIEPRRNCWTLPAGFMEVGESLAEGALRETQEEAGLDCSVGQLFSIIDVVHVAQVHFYYLAEMHSDTVQPGPETVTTRLCTPEEIPWDRLAFRSVTETLQRYFADAASGCVGEQLHTLTIS